MRLNITLHALTTFLLFVSVAYSAEDHRQHDAHEHGEAQLNIALEGSTLHLELDSPAMNLIGFEHRPRDKKQHAVLQQAITMLKQGPQLFALAPAARCTLAKANVETPLQGAHEKHQHEQEEEHADFNAHYLFECPHAAALQHIEVRLFKLFPGIEELAVQLLTDTGQYRMILHANDPVIKLK